MLLKKNMMIKCVVAFFIGVFAFIGVLSQPVLANEFNGWRVIEDSYIKDTYVGNDDRGNLVYINHVKRFETVFNGKRATGIAVDYKVVSPSGKLINKETMNFRYFMNYWARYVEGASGWLAVIYQNKINDYTAYAIFNYLSNLNPEYFPVKKKKVGALARSQN